MITCEEFLAEIGDYLENEVSPEVRKELELHLAQCRACHVLYDDDGDDSDSGNPYDREHNKCIRGLL